MDMGRRGFLKLLGLTPVVALAPRKAYSFLGGILRRPTHVLRDFKISEGETLIGSGLMDCHLVAVRGGFSDITGMRIPYDLRDSFQVVKIKGLVMPEKLRRVLTMENPNTLVIHPGPPTTAYPLGDGILTCHTLDMRSATPVPSTLTWSGTWSHTGLIMPGNDNPPAIG